MLNIPGIHSESMDPLQPSTGPEVRTPPSLGLSSDPAELAGGAEGIVTAGDMRPGKHTAGGFSHETW